MRLFRFILTGLALFVVACQSGSIQQRNDVASVDFTVLSLNLHTYQEFRSEGVAESALNDDLVRERIDSYGALFDRIADGINEIDPDIVSVWTSTTSTPWIGPITASMSGSKARRF